MKQQCEHFTSKHHFIWIARKCSSMFLEHTYHEVIMHIRSTENHINSSYGLYQLILQYLLQVKKNISNPVKTFIFSLSLISETTLDSIPR